MMATAEEIPTLLVVDTNEAECADGTTQEWRSPPSVAAAAAVSKVLEDDNLLIDILLCLGFPTTLVRAALVCKRWYHHASDRRFLDNFRKRHPPRLLGFYIDEPLAPRFVPVLPQPLELAAVVRRVAGYSLGPNDATLWINNCRNGSILITICCKGRKWTLGLHRPLCPEGDMPIVPPLPRTQDLFQKTLGTVLSKEEESGLSYMFVLAEWTTGENSKISVYVLQDGAWCLRTMATNQIFIPLTASNVVLASNKIYMTDSYSNGIIVLDLTTSSLSRIPLPQEMKCRRYSTALSRANDDSGVYLTHVHGKELQLCIWLHKGDNWLLVHTICLHEMCPKMRVLDQTLEDERTYLCHVGDNAEFVFLKMCGCTLYLDVTGKTLHKVHETTEKNQYFRSIYPFMMTWPPIFPALKDDPARNDM